MNFSAKFIKDAFDQMLASFCKTNGYTVTIARDTDDVYRYIFRNTEFRSEFMYFIHVDAFAKDSIYLRFKDLTEEVDRYFDKIARQRSREKVYISTSNTYMKDLDRAFAEYCKADVEATKRMAKFFDPDKTPEIKDVIFNYPATIVVWADGTKTVVKAHDDDVYDPEKGLAMAICKKVGGNKWSYYNKFKHWLKKIKPTTGDFEQVSHTTKVIDS